MKLIVILNDINGKYAVVIFVQQPRSCRQIWGQHLLVVIRRGIVNRKESGRGRQGLESLCPPHEYTLTARRGAMHEGSQAEGKGNGSRFELISQKINCKRLNLFKILQPLEIIYVVQIH